VIKKRKLGPYSVSSIGLGCMNLSEIQIEEKAIEIIHNALDKGINLFDTADIYGNGNNEVILGKALDSWNGSSTKKSQVVIATKAGIVSSEKKIGVKKFLLNSTFSYLCEAVEKSAKRISIDKIPLWQHHRADPGVSYSVQIENILKLKMLGYVGAVGISNASAEMLRCAIKVGGTPEQGGIVSVQNEFSLYYRCWQEVIEICEQFGIAFIPWSPFGGKNNSHRISGGEINIINEIAIEKKVSPYSVVIAWHLAKSSNSIPIPGVSKIPSLTDSVTGASINLSEEEINKIDLQLPESELIRPELISMPDCN